MRGDKPCVFGRCQNGTITLQDAADGARRRQDGARMLITLHRSPSRSITLHHDQAAAPPQPSCGPWTARRPSRSITFHHSPSHSITLHHDQAAAPPQPSCGSAQTGARLGTHTDTNAHTDTNGSAQLGENCSHFGQGHFEQTSPAFTSLVAQGQMSVI